MKVCIFFSLATAVFTSMAFAETKVLEGLKLDSGSFFSSHNACHESCDTKTSEGVLSGVNFIESNDQLIIQADIVTKSVTAEAKFADLKTVTLTIDTFNWKKSLAAGNADDSRFPGSELAPNAEDGSGILTTVSGNSFPSSYLCTIDVNKTAQGKQAVNKLVCYYLDTSKKFTGDAPVFIFNYRSEN